MKIFKKILFPLLVFFLLGSVILFSYPTISNFVNQIFNESKIESYSNNVRITSKEETEKILKKAEL